MRHIQIKITTIIVTILISVSSYGQMQQILKNGFVAATDSGMWYLQDGFNEWVNIKYTNYGENVPSDSIFSISFNKILYFNTYVYNSEFDNHAIYTHGLFGSYINEFFVGTSYINPEITTKDIISQYKYYNCITRYCKGTSSSDIIIKINNSYGFVSDVYESSDLRYLTSQTSDNDSIFCWCGTNNKLYKGAISLESLNRTMISVSGLHSRTTDSHKICYNPDDDEFIIVSDSGIVYSYDKTTLTTVDTIQQSLLPLNSTITDIENYEGSLLVGYKNNLGNGVLFFASGSQEFSLYTSSSTSDVLISKGSSYMGDYNKIFMFVLSSNNIILRTMTTIEGKINKNAHSLNNRTIFDLDYINYLP